MKQSKYIPSIPFFADEQSMAFARFLTPPVLAAYQLRTPQNAGSLIRLAANTGAKEVILINDPETLKPAGLKKTAASAIGEVNWNIISPQKWEESIPDNYALVAIETASNATNIFTTELPDKCLFLAGSERYGLPEEILNKCNHIVYIPMPGTTKSMNITHAMAVVLFQWMGQQFYKFTQK